MMLFITNVSYTMSLQGCIYNGLNKFFHKEVKKPTDKSRFLSLLIICAMNELGIAEIRATMVNYTPIEAMPWRNNSIFSLSATRQFLPADVFGFYEYAFERKESYRFLKTSL